MAPVDGAAPSPDYAKFIVSYILRVVAFLLLW
jgi:hypothetical protein